MQRPNILFAFADDWGRYASIYGTLERDNPLCRIINTPNIDRVAREGALFTNALVPAPTCTPCRSAVLSGRYFWQTGLGAILQGAVWDRRVPSYPFLLEDAGYHIGFTYKVWAPGTPMDDPYGGTGNRYQNAGNRYSGYSQFVTKHLREGGTIEAGKGIIDEEVRQNYRDFRAAQPSADKPFCYWWGPVNTHRPWQQGSGKELWGIDPDTLKGKLPDFLPDVHEVREDVADYLGECMAFDRGLGVLLAELEASGELDNTLIVVSGDHGIPGFPRAKTNLYDIGCEVALMARLPGTIPAGHVVEDMVNLMDLAPTFLDAAGVEVPDSMAGKSLMPLLTTGQSGQIDPARTFVITGRERHVATARDKALPYPMRALRTHDYLYIRNFAPDRWPCGDPKGLDDPTTTPPAYEELIKNSFCCYSDMDGSPTKAWMVHHRAEASVCDVYELGFHKRPAEELYDIHNDPHHMRNLAGDPAFESTRQQLSDMLMAELTRQRDPRVTEQPCRFEESPFTDTEFPDEAAERRNAMVRWS